MERTEPVPVCRQPGSSQDSDLGHRTFQAFSTRAHLSQVSPPVCGEVAAFQCSPQRAGSTPQKQPPIIQLALTGSFLELFRREAKA